MFDDWLVIEYTPDLPYNFRFAEKNTRILDKWPFFCLQNGQTEIILSK